MKRILFVIICFLLIGCSNKNPYENIPDKIVVSGTSASDSSVKTTNIDNYLFREDSIYVDLRPYSWVAKDGHIAGFSFFPFYDFIADRSEEDRLFLFRNTKKDDGTLILGGEPGSYTANYEESEQIINIFFPKDKYIFVISQSGLESTYFLNLLIQLGYNPEKLYNVGGFANGTGFDNIAYVNVENAKYLVKGNGILEGQDNITFNFYKDLTPIS